MCPLPRPLSGGLSSGLVSPQHKTVSELSLTEVSRNQIDFTRYTDIAGQSKLAQTDQSLRLAPLFNAKN